jgi:hypothetical protein
MKLGQVSQVGDDLLPRTGAGADVLDQLPVTVGLAALLDDRATEKHGCHPSCESWLKTIMTKANRSIGQIRFVTTRVFLDFRKRTAMAATPEIPKWSNYYICLRKTG